jgi:beta-xylosidase
LLASAADLHVPDLFFVEVALAGLPLKAGEARLEHFGIDDERSNGFTAWKAMGSPQRPTVE